MTTMSALLEPLDPLEALAAELFAEPDPLPEPLPPEPLPEPPEPCRSRRSWCCRRCRRC